MARESGMYRTRQIRIKKGNRLYPYLTGLCENSALLYNRANILRKVFPNVKGWDRGVVDTPYVVRIA